MHPQLLVLLVLVLCLACAPMHLSHYHLLETNELDQDGGTKVAATLRQKPRDAGGGLKLAAAAAVSGCRERSATANQTLESADAGNRSSRAANGAGQRHRRRRHCADGALAVAKGRSLQATARGKLNKKKKLLKWALPLLLAYKLKFFALVPLLVSGLVLLVGATGAAGFFFALFAATISIKSHNSHKDH